VLLLFILVSKIGCVLPINKKLKKGN